MARWRDRYYPYPPSRPRAARGGIRAQSQRGGFGESWWAKRWIATLEGFDIGDRLKRGRIYARKGQVLSVEVEKGKIAALVQGSRPQPYAVTIAVKVIAHEAWGKVAEMVAGQAVFASKLLGGEMPREMEGMLSAAGESLFPARYHDLTTECSCPDWANPCKHIAAVYYLLGEEFDRDPFLIFRMRGMGREEFLGLLGERGASRGPVEVALPPEPLPAVAFWASGAVPEELAGEVPVAGSGAAIARRLGKFPFWRGSDTLLEFLESVYGRAARAAAEVLEGSNGHR